MKAFSIQSVLVMAVVAGGACTAYAAVVTVSSPYLSTANSTLNPLSPTYYLEDFEDGILNIPGVSVVATAGSGVAAGFSVDADDGSIDGFGAAGQSFWADASTGQSNTTFYFSPVAGQWPRRVALALTMGVANSLGFTAYDTSLNPSGTLSMNVITWTTTADDFLVTFTDNAGIAAIAMVSNTALTSVHYDHLQFDTAEVPEPATLSLLALGVLALGRRQRRVGAVVRQPDRVASPTRRPSMKVSFLLQAFPVAVVVALCANSTQAAAMATYYRDTDNDTWGDSFQTTQVAGMPPAGWVVIGYDAVDTNALIHPGAFDIPADGIDNNLNGTIDETNSVLGPTITYPNPTLFTVTAGQLLSVPVTVQSDVENEPVGFRPFYTIPSGSSFAAGPAGAICNGTFQWTPTIADLGWHTAVFPAGYSAGASVVGDSDAGIVIQVVPEPATLSLLALGGLALLRRKRA